MNTDRNMNGIPDSMERRSGDMNGNGIPDALERRSSLGDRNGNGIPDVLEGNRTHTGARLGDMNGNGIPDSMERRSNLGDRNGNGIPDVLEGNRTHTGARLGDLNGNGIPDSMERRSSFGDRNGNGIPDSLERQGMVGSFASTTNVVQVQLPVKIIENAAVVHEEIRQERVEEIQPVVNIEKIKTEVHQVTQPLIDKEVRAVNVEQRVLATQILPEVITPGGIAAARDVSTVNYQQTQQIVVEKPAIYAEVDKTQIIQEIQPVIYKETVVPVLIKETQPVYQKIVEGAVYTQQTLPPMQLHGSRYESVSVNSVAPVLAQTHISQTHVHSGVPMQQTHVHSGVPMQSMPVSQTIPVQMAPIGRSASSDVRDHKVVETTTTTTTTSVPTGAQVPF